MVKNTLNVGSISEGLCSTISKQAGAWISTNICILTNWTAVLPSSRTQKAIKWVKKILSRSNAPSTSWIWTSSDSSITTSRSTSLKDEKIVEKKQLKLPKEIRNVIRCKNPRCITSIEQGLDHVFVLTDEENQIYRCKYCEEKYRRRR